MALLLYFIIYLYNLNIINSKRQSIKSKIFKKILPKSIFEKIKITYNVNLKIIENKSIIKEFLINTSYISKEYYFDFLYTGKFLYLNDTNNDIITNKAYSDNNWILLIQNFKIFEKYFSKYRNVIKKSTKVILVPNNTIKIIDIIAKYCLYDLSIYLIEIEENSFNQIKNNFVRYNNNTNYYGEIITKKYELFPFKKL